jgi:D-3-phosphoglycerate dehydrogenase
MAKFRVALSGDFLKADGSPALPEFDLTPLSGSDIEHFHLPAGPEIRAADLENADALVLLAPKFTRDSVPASGRLALVARFGVGYNTVDLDACTDNAIALVITPDGVRRPVAVAVITLMLALTGNLFVKDRITRQGPPGWAQKTNHNGFGLVGRTLGSVGLGNIGAEVFRLAKPFDMQFLACDPYVDPAVAAELGVRLVDLPTLFRESDVVSVNTFLNEDTEKLVNAELLALMKPTAYLINTSRGPIVDQKALTEVLQARRIAGAGLDVLEQEPTEADDPLFQLDNVIVTPHALCWTDQLFQGIGAADSKAVLDVMHGRAPVGIVNRAIVDNRAWLDKLAAYKARFGD